MKYTKSLSRLNNITDMKIATEMSEISKLENKKHELEELKSKLEVELENGKNDVKLLINKAVTKIADYYKIRSAIAALSNRLLIIETRITSVNDNIDEIVTEVLQINVRVASLRKKKKKFEKLLSEGLRNE